MAKPYTNSGTQAAAISGPLIAADIPRAHKTGSIADQRAKGGTAVFRVSRLPTIILDISAR